MTSVFIGLGLKLVEFIIDRFIQNAEAKRRAAKWIEAVQSRHDAGAAKLSRQYERLVKKYEDSRANTAQD